MPPLPNKGFIRRGGTLRVYCDECNDLIKDAELAMYAWEGEVDQSEGGAIPYILHKVPCSDRFQERSGLDRFSWQELIRFPFFFGEGTNVDWHQVGEL